MAINRRSFLKGAALAMAVVASDMRLARASAPVYQSPWSQLPPNIANAEIAEKYVLKEGYYKGSKYVIGHNGLGHRCGYVRLLPEDVLFDAPALDGWDEDGDNLDAHGGVDWDQQGLDAPGRWIAFNCCHSDDKPDPELPLDCPEVVDVLAKKGMDYYDIMAGVQCDSRVATAMFTMHLRTQEFVESECESLIDQIKARNTMTSRLRRLVSS